MIRESQSWTPSELIYLFADGEADDVQKSLLFAALANDAGLQAEFSDALRINAAIKDVGLEENPPKQVTAALFRKAGFAAAAERTSRTFGGAAFFGGTLAVSRLRYFVVPFVSAIVGGMIALLFAPEIRQLSNRESSAIGTEKGSARHEIRQPNSSSLTSALPGAQDTRTLDPVEQTEGLPTSKRKVEAINTTPKNDRSIVPVPKTSEKSIRETERREPLLLDTQLQSLPAARAITSASHPIAAISMENARAIGESTQPGSASFHALSTTQPTSLEFEDPRFTVQVRGLADLEMFPHRSYTTERSKGFENFAVAGFYNLSRNHSIGIEVGREYHPLYVPTGSAGISMIGAEPTPVIGITINGTGPAGGNFTGTGTGAGGNLRNADMNANPPDPDSTNRVPSATEGTAGYRLEPITSWFGVSYQFRAAPIDRLGLIRPFIQTMVGGTQFGPIGKGTVGFSWTPDSRVSFNLGVEGTAVLYSNNGEWYSSRKLGLAYSAQISF